MNATHRPHRAINCSFQLSCRLRAYMDTQKSPQGNSRRSPPSRFIDFGLAGVFPVNGTHPKKNTALNGTLNYLSPEQTGRVSRPVDYRSDLYSFGVVLYQLATGQLPLTSDDPLELIHCMHSIYSSFCGDAQRFISTIMSTRQSHIMRI